MDKDLDPSQNLLEGVREMASLHLVRMVMLHKTMQVDGELIKEAILLEVEVVVLAGVKLPMSKMKEKEEVVVVAGQVKTMLQNLEEVPLGTKEVEEMLTWMIHHNQKDVLEAALSAEKMVTLLENAQIQTLVEVIEVVVVDVVEDVEKVEVVEALVMDQES